MRILAIDTSCDDSCAAIIDTQNWKLLADVVQSHIKPMAPFGGVVPELASREHVKALPLVVEEAFLQAGMKMQDIDWIGVTHRPGLMGSLLVGVSYAKALAYSLGKPLTMLDHIQGHLYSPLLAETEERGSAPPFPWIALVVSGGHTELFHVRDALDATWLGGTLDDAAGEAFDKIGKMLGLGYPAGPVMDRMVQAQDDPCHKSAFAFPRAKVGDYEFSFSGLKTAVRQKIDQQEDPSCPLFQLQVVASSQQAIIDALVKPIEKAQKALGVSQVVVTGGVACNSHLRKRLAHAHFPKFKHCTDNAAMMAIVTALLENAGKLTASPLTERPSPVAHF